MSLKSLQDLCQKTVEQIEFLENFYKYMPVTISDSPMNMLCQYIEGINFDISKKIKVNNEEDILPILKSDMLYTHEEYLCVSNLLTDYIKQRAYLKQEETDNDNLPKDKALDDYDIIRSDILKLVDVNIAVNCVVDYFYQEYPSKNKDIMWSIFGREIFNNVKLHTQVPIKFPLQDKNGDIDYLGEKYSMQEVDVYESI